MPTAPPLIGEYSTPAVTRGARVTCLYRDRDSTVTSTTDAPLPWPRVQPRDHRGGSGLWVNDELVRAIRTESAAAMGYWFGVSVGVVWKWRKAFGVGGRATTQGSKQAIRAAARKGADAVRAKVWTDAELDVKAATARRIGLLPGPRWTPTRGGWTAAQVALLGTDHDAAVAQVLGRTRSAVTSQRTRRKIPAFSGPRGGRKTWDAEKLALLGTDHDAAIAARIGHTPNAVTQRRVKLNIPAFQNQRRG